MNFKIRLSYRIKNMQQLVFIMFHGNKILMEKQNKWPFMLNYLIVPMKMLVIFKMKNFILIILMGFVIILSLTHRKSIQVD